MLRRVTTLLATGALAASMTGGAAHTHSGAHAAEGSLEELQPLLESVTAGIPVGAVIQVEGPTAASWSSAAGISDRRTGRAAFADDRVRVASVTKPMVATLVMQEVARGRWTLDTAAADVLPALFHGREDITVRQLLSHTSGLPDHLAALLAGAVDTTAFYRIINAEYRDRPLVELALALPPTGEPGGAFSYSNTNYLVLGMMLRKVTGTSLARLLEHRVFRPAQMDDSFLDRAPGLGPRSLTEYAYLGALYPLRRFDPTMFSGAGAVVSTPDDVNRFFAALLHGRLVPASYVEQMLTPVDPGTGYGLGLFALPDPCPAPDGSQQYLVGHDGGSLGTLTLALSSPDGSRQLMLAWTGRDLTRVAPPRSVEELAVAALLATCPSEPPTRRVAPRLELPSYDVRLTSGVRSSLRDGR